MLSDTQEQALVDICDTFINSGDNVTLAHLLDFVNATIPDHESQEWKSWTKHMEQLNEIWRQINKEGEKIPWPKPPVKRISAAIPDKGETPTSSALVSVKVFDDEWQSMPISKIVDFIAKICTDRQIGGQGVGPIRQEKSFSGARKAGKPRDELVDKLIVETEEQSQKTKDGKRQVVYCIGCQQKASGQNPHQIKQHAKDCSQLAKKFPSLYAKVMENLVERAHSTRLEKHSEEAQGESKPSTQQGTLLEYMHPTRIPDQAKIKIEWLMFRMFICCALPWALMDNQFFTDFVEGLAPNFTVPDRSAFFPKHLAQEVAVWGKGFKKFIESQTHLTFSLDGWSTRARDELYTFHTTTTKCRSFFTDGHVFKGESVTGEALFNVILKLLVDYNPRKYSAIAGDGGPNVRSAKIKITTEFTWIINIYDPCHNLNLFMKDVGKLFKPMLTTVSGIANYFGKSNYGTYHLDEERKKSGISEGIKSNSETRFSSSYYQVVSVHTCMPPIKKCVQLNTLKFDTAATKKLRPYIDDTPAHYRFMGELAAFINLLAPAANGILTLEGQNTNCADVFYVWVCIAYHLEKALGNPSNGLTTYRPSVVLAYNHRFQQMMTESSHCVFLLGYYLHPLFRHHGGLQLTMPPLKEGQILQPYQYPVLFTKLLTSVLEIFKGEQVRLQDSGKGIIPKLINQVIAYAYNHEPFCSNLWTRKTKPLKWWMQIAADSNANLIARVAIKVFSISPSEICDERTASRLGWFNAARRSSITPEHLIDSANPYSVLRLIAPTTGVPLGMTRIRTRLSLRSYLA